MECIYDKKFEASAKEIIILYYGLAMEEINKIGCFYNANKLWEKLIEMYKRWFWLKNYKEWSIDESIIKVQNTRARNGESYMEGGRKSIIGWLLLERNWATMIWFGSYWMHFPIY